jgi:hypothetical protein
MKSKIFKLFFLVLLVVVGINLGYSQTWVRAQRSAAPTDSSLLITLSGGGLDSSNIANPLYLSPRAGGAADTARSLFAYNNGGGYLEFHPNRFNSSSTTGYKFYFYQGDTIFLSFASNYRRSTSNPNAATGGRLRFDTTGNNVGAGITGNLALWTNAALGWVLPQAKILRDSNAIEADLMDSSSGANVKYKTYRHFDPDTLMIAFTGTDSMSYFLSNLKVRVNRSVAGATIGTIPATAGFLYEAGTPLYNGVKDTLVAYYSRGPLNPKRDITGAPISIKRADNYYWEYYPQNPYVAGFTAQIFNGAPCPPPGEILLINIPAKKINHLLYCKKLRI